MSNLQHRQSIIQEKRKKTPWRDFVMEICSFRNLMFYRVDEGISKYPQYPLRKKNLISIAEKNEQDLSSFYNLDIDTSKNFLDQLSQIYYELPFPVVNHYGIQENSAWGDEIRGAKNVYLSVAVGDGAENVLYTFKGESNVCNIINCTNITQNCENIYHSKTVRNSSFIFYSKFIYNSQQIRFSDNLIGCNECLFCNGLENVAYYIHNIQYSKEDYFLKKRELLMDKSLFENNYMALTKQGINKLCERVTGHTLYNCHDVDSAYELSNFERARNILYCDGGNDSSDCYDAIDSASDRTHHLYAVMGQAFGDHIYCSGNIVESSNIYYSFMLQNCSFCIGCMWLTNKSYCILNKQYTKEERYEKVDEIFGQMHADGVLGDFFPASMNPFYFNDTAAYLIDPSFTKEEVTAKGFLRRDEPIKVDIPAGVQTVSVKDLDKYEGWKPRSVSNVAQDAVKIEQDVRRFGKMPEDTTMGKIIGHHNSSSDILPENQHIQQLQWYIDDEILKKVIIDEQGNAYRIIPMELEFLRKYELPLPRKHWLDRMKENFRIN